MKTKRVLSLMLAVCIAGALMAGCISRVDTKEEATSQVSETVSGESADQTSTEASAGDEVTTGETFKIGFYYLPPTDTLSAAFHKALDYTAAQFGCEMMYGEAITFTSEEALAVYENQIQAGVDAVIAVSIPAAAIELFNENQIYFVVGGNTITDPDTLQMAMESPYYCGSIMADEVVSGYQLCEKVYDAGSRNIAYISIPAGMAQSHDDRVRGIEKFAEEHSDMKIITNYRGVEFFSSTGPTDEILAAFPEVDGIITTAGVATVPAAIYSAGMQNDIKYATIDIQKGVDTWFKDGFMAGCQGGQYPVMQIAFTVLYEALSTGDMLITDMSKPFYGPYIWLTSYDEYNQYIQYMDGDIPAYTGDELKKMCGNFNSEVSLEDRQEMFAEAWASYSLQDVIARHKDLF
jgi:ABC-type sugar transport system substrate-binding protein